MEATTGDAHERERAKVHRPAGSRGPRLIRYRLPVGDHFVIDARMRERIFMEDEEVVDLEVSFELDCEVTGEEAGSVWIRGELKDPRVKGSLSATFDLTSLAGLEVRVRKGLDGTIHAAENGDALERVLGGLSVANALRWFGATFASGPVSPGDRWGSEDRWALSAERSPLGLRLPLRPEVNVRYDFELEGWRSVGSRTVAEVGVGMSFSGRHSSEELGLELEVAGTGSGRVDVDLEAGKLRTSTRRATIDFVAKPASRRAVSLPSLSLERWCEAGVRT